MKDKIQNIILISLDAKFAKSLSAALASTLEMHFSDCQELIEYDLIERGAILEKCGLEYLRERETFALKNMLGFHNTVLSCNYDLFKNNKRLFAENLICYLSLPQTEIGEDNVINKLAFATHHQFLENNCDIILSLKNKNEKSAAKKLVQALGEYYENK